MGWSVKTQGTCKQAVSSGCFKSLQDIWLGGAWPGLFSLCEVVCRRGRGTAVSGIEYLHTGPLLFANISSTSSSSLFCYLSSGGEDRRVPRTVQNNILRLRRRNTNGQGEGFFFVVFTVRVHIVLDKLLKTTMWAELQFGGSEDHTKTWLEKNLKALLMKETKHWTLAAALL